MRYQIAFLNINNIYEYKKDIYEYPLFFNDFNETMEYVKKFIEHGYEVVIKCKDDDSE